MDRAAGKLPMEHADETFTPIRMAMKRYLRQSAGLSRKTPGHVPPKVGGNISVAVQGTEGGRVNNADEQDTSQHTRKQRVNTT